nr:PREDICTED: uncharacterized protein LOC107982626 [Anolis carolinensis]|eukprot:XP_016847769.1 PREDICTED: uncharacterized protein LOC107982626 [Anolis carolinensis]
MVGHETTIFAPVTGARLPASHSPDLKGKLFFSHFPRRAMAPKRSTRAAAGIEKELPARTTRPPRSKAAAEREPRRKAPSKAPMRKAAPKRAGKQDEGALEGISQNLARLVDRMGKLESRVYQRSDRASVSPQGDAPRGRRRTRDKDVSRTPSTSPASSGDDSTTATERTERSGGSARKKSRRSSRRCCQTTTDSDSAERVVATSFPDRAWHLANHQKTVVKARRMAGEAAAIAYDEAFRKRASQSARVRWDLTNHDIWLTEVGPSIKSKADAGKPDRGWGRRDSRRAVCWEFNLGKCQRARCRFDHLCEYCSGNHTKMSCGKSSSNGQPFRSGQAGAQPGFKKEGGASNGSSSARTR